MALRPTRSNAFCALVALTLPCVARAARAQACERVESRTTLGAFAGERIRSLKIVADGPGKTGIMGRLSALHVKTRNSAIRQRLLLAEGEPLDTARVAESMRRLRRLRFLDDVVLIGERCAGLDGVAVTVSSRDAWSTSPEARLASSNTKSELDARSTSRLPDGLVGFEERNLLGTGRELHIGMESRNGRVGGSGSLADPLTFGLPLVTRMRVSRLPNERSEMLTLRSDDRAVESTWRSDVLIRRIARTQDDGGSVGRRSLHALVGRRVSNDSAATAMFVSSGFEMQRAAVRAPNTFASTTNAMARDFRGVDIGLDRIGARYRSVDWLLPHGGIVDVPRGVEMSTLVGVGRDALSNSAAMHGDVWIGRVWAPVDRSLLWTDAWTSGFMNGGRVTGGALRATVTGVASARRGLWTVRTSAERRVAPDPDIAPFGNPDVTTKLLGPDARFARSILAASLERAVRFGLGRTAFDIAGFGAGSLRRMGPSPIGASADRAIAVVGVGLHAVPPSAGRSALRLDYMMPVASGAGVRRQPYFAVSFSPGYGTDRLRDGRRVR